MSLCVWLPVSRGSNLSRWSGWPTGSSSSRSVWTFWGSTGPWSGSGSCRWTGPSPRLLLWPSGLSLALWGRRRRRTIVRKNENKKSVFKIIQGEKNSLYEGFNFMIKVVIFENEKAIKKSNFLLKVTILLQNVFLFFFDKKKINKS